MSNPTEALLLYFIAPSSIAALLSIGPERRKRAPYLIGKIGWERRMSEIDDLVIQAVPRNLQRRAYEFAIWVSLRENLAARLIYSRSA